MAEMNRYKPGMTTSSASTAVGEQLMNKDSLTVHKLELENQRLRSELDDLQLNGLRQQSDKLLELEQEIKRKDLTLKQVVSGDETWVYSIQAFFFDTFLNLKKF